MKRFFNGQYVGLKDDNEKTIIPAEYDYIWVHKNEYAIVRKICFYGVIRLSDKKEIVPPKFAHAEIKDKYIIISSMKKYGVYSLDGTLIVPPTLTKEALVEFEKTIA